MVMANESGCNRNFSLNRRSFLGLGAGAVVAGVSGVATAQTGRPDAGKVVNPPAGKKILLATKLSMIAGEADGKKLSLAERLRMAGDAGFDGVDFDEAGGYTPEQARDAVRESGVFVHNAINHDHWKMRLTSAKDEERAQGRKNIEHCLRVSHAAGGSGVLIVLGQAADGPAEEIEERACQEIRKMLPLAGSLGQMILIENVWNKMMYEHDKGPEQTPERFIKFIDSLNSPWVGMYHDVGNHWKYGQPGDWIRAFGRRCVKMDAKGFSRAKNNWTELTGPDDDLPWADVRKALAEIDFNGWATAEVGGGDVKRLTTVREEMQKAFLG